MSVAALSIAVAHTEGLGSIERVAAEKASLLWSLPESGTAIYRADHPALIAQLAPVRAQRRIAFGTAPAADVQLVGHALTAAPSMRIQGRSEWSRWRMRVASRKTSSMSRSP